jgi:hypothetical protein
MMMIDWLKEEKKTTTWHLDSCMYRSMMNFKKRTQLYVLSFQRITTLNYNSSRTTLVNYGSILSLVLSSIFFFSLLGIGHIDWRRTRKTILLLFYHSHFSLVYTRANCWSTIQMWISRSYNCKNKKIKKLFILFL